MKKAVMTAAIVFFVAIQFYCNKGQGQQQKPRLDTFEEKSSYMIGLDIGNDFKRMGIKVEYNAFLWAVKDVVEDRPVLLTKGALDSVKMAMLAKMQQSQQGQDMLKQGENNLKAGEAFFTENKKKPGVVTTTSGLQYFVHKKGNGPKPKAGDKVKVYYSGKLLDGTEFDNSLRHGNGEPMVFPLQTMVPGWIEGLQLMNVGSKYTLFIPSTLGYGEITNAPGGPNSTLIFDVELLGIEK